MSIITNPNGIEQQSITATDFEERYVPLLNQVAELVISHPDIPEEYDQSDLLGALTTITTEFRNEVTGRVPEIVRLQDALAKKDRQITKLQETNQQLYLRVGALPDPNKKDGDGSGAPPRLTFEQIKRKLESL